MAIRINVTAVRDCPQAEVRAVMSETIRLNCGPESCPPVGEQLEVTEHGGWTWFNTSVWGVSGADLNRGLCKLARPALQFTTSDGDRWYLTVHGGPRGRMEFVHEFSYHGNEPDPDEDDSRMEELQDFSRPPRVDKRLAFLQDDPKPGRGRPLSAFDLVADGLNEMGAGIPESLREEYAGLTYSEAVGRYRKWHADQVAEALAAAGIPFDAKAVRRALLWESVTDAECEGDLGNLPRLLTALGLGGQWDQYIAQAEGRESEDDEDDDEAPPPEPVDLFTPVLSHTSGLTLTPVAGGPVPLPLEDLERIAFPVAALAIEFDVGAVIDVTLPPNPRRKSIPSPPRDSAGRAEATATGFRGAFSSQDELDQDSLASYLGRPLAKRLRELPKGAVVDVSFALEGRPELTQRYLGEAGDGVWRISETYPPLTHKALADALVLARAADKTPARFSLRDEAEAQAVAELAGRDLTLRGLPVERKGKVVSCKLDYLGRLCRVIFRHRFADSWDVAGHDREADRLEQERARRESQMRRAAAEAERRRFAPHDDQPIYRGKLGAYWRSDFARLDELEQDTRASVDATLGELGFRVVGDLVAKKRREVLMRVYRGDDGATYAILMAKRTMYLGCEYFSRFDDGSTLTTTINDMTESLPELKVYAKVCPGLQLPALHEKHLWAIGRFLTRKKTRPVTLPDTLEGAAREYDRAVALREGVGQMFRIVAPSPGEAPEEIRAAWVGCVLPLFATTDDERVDAKAKGVVSKKRAKHSDGFTVRVVDAVEALEDHNPDAARWWRENTPDLMEPGRLFIFPGTVCELVED